MKVDTSVRKGRSRSARRWQGLAADAQYVLRARVADGAGTQVAGVHQQAVPGRAICKDGRIAVTEKWKPEKLWDMHTPQNHVRGRTCRWWTPRARCSTRAVPCGSASASSGSTAATSTSTARASSSRRCRWTMPRSARHAASYEAAKESMLRLKSFGINFVYTHNYGCEPGAHLSFAEILRAADDVGMLVALSQPHFGQYDWDSAGRRPDERLRARTPSSTCAWRRTIRRSSSTR